VEPDRAPVPQARINEMIRAPKVRLVDDDGSQIGVKDTNEAREYAWGKNLDLVEVAAQADPPVAKVMDYGKYRYEQEQKAKLARKHQVSVNVKEIKLRPKIGIHDYNTKKGHVERFLNQRAKVKVTIMFRGREQSHPERGRDLLMRLAEDVKEIGQIESPPLQDGRNMVMLLGPTKNAGVTKDDAKAEDTQRNEEAVQGDGTGKLLRRKAPKAHLLEKKSPKRKRGFRRDQPVADSDTREIKSCWGGRPCRESSDPSTRARSAARCSSRRAATGASSTPATGAPRSRSTTRWSTPTATARTRSARSGGSGSCASTRPRGARGSRTTSSSPGLRKAEIPLDRKVLADLAVSDPDAFGKIAAQAKAALEA
jgi:translation initiation factor IF-3